MENIKHGRRREGRWTPIRAKAQDTRANPNSSETHLVRKRWDIGLLRALNPRIMMMMMMKMINTACPKSRGQMTHSPPPDAHDSPPSPHSSPHIMSPFPSLPPTQLPLLFTFRLPISFPSLYFQ